MDSVFVKYDPSKWTHSEKTSREKIKKGLDRSANGVSFYDWINFNSFYGWTIFKTLKLIVNKKVSVSEHTIKEAEDLLIAAKVARKELKKAEKDFFKGSVDSYLSAVEGPIMKEREIVFKFFKNILPELKFVKDYEPQNIDRPNIFVESDIKSLGSHLLQVWITGLNRFITDGSGYPGKLTDEIWNEKLTHIIKESVLIDPNVEGSPDWDGFEDFILELYGALWD